MSKMSEGQVNTSLFDRNKELEQEAISLRADLLGQHGVIGQQQQRIAALEAERDELRSRTELAESRLAVMVERDGARDEQLRLACRERDELRARLTELERQEPVAWIANTPHSYCTTKLYARPVAAIPEGWKLVPVEATEAMLDAEAASCGPAWGAMLAAAPEYKA